MKKLYFAQEMNPISHEEEDVYFAADDNTSIADIITAMTTAESPFDRFRKFNKIGREINGCNYAEYFQADDCIALTFNIEDGTIDIGLSERCGNHLFDVDTSTSVTEILEMICRAEWEKESEEYFNVNSVNSDISDEDLAF